MYIEREPIITLRANNTVILSTFEQKHQSTMKERKTYR